jgi:hypothetical protein
MSAPTILPAHWPPLDGDVWVDRHGVEWVTQTWEANDEVRCALHRVAGGASATPGRLLESAGPLTLEAKGWERLRNERMVAEFATGSVGGMR